jgi:dihydroorotate dehydrogenase
MMRALSALALPLLLKLEPEKAHRAAIGALRWASAAPPPCDPRLKAAAFGLSFPNPLGMAAGFDKNAEVPAGLLGAGFGFVEVGTLTPRPQPGNPKPRLFRLQSDQALINRLGFNNDGYAAAHDRLLRARASGIVGVNIGPNKDSTDRTADYVLGVKTFADVASYFTINISSPNTPGLRDLQQGQLFDDLLARVVDARARASRRAGLTPLLIKIAPDLSLSELDDVVGAARRRRVDGMIVGNTTVVRPPNLRDAKAARESGGLSGRPLFALSTRMLAETYVRAEGAFPLVGTGGIDSGRTALAKIRAGASLVQLYSSLVFRGLGLVGEIKSELVQALAPGRQAGLPELVGVDAAAMTAERWPR